MEKYKISQGVACVMKGEKILVQDGYGVSKDTIFRIASITKLFTRVSILKLIEQSSLSLESAVFPLLKLEALPGEEFNSDLNEITVQHLLDHEGGWDSKVTGIEPLFNQKEIARYLAKPVGELTPEEVVRYMLSQPLQFKPGTKRAYSGFGYCVLGRVIEKVSGLKYEEYIRQKVTLALGLNSIQLGHTEKDKTLPNEASYEKDSDIYSPGDPYDPTVLHLGINDSAGGLISNSGDLCKFLNHYWGNGKPRHEQVGHYFYVTGRNIGTLALALQTSEGLNAAILFNNRHNRDNKKDDELRILVESTLKDI